MNEKPVYAEDIGHYWKTSQKSPDGWIEAAKELLSGIGANLLFDAYGNIQGEAAYIIAFELDGHKYKISWPVLESKTGNERAAKRQAATMLFHDIKNRCVSAKALGARGAFFGYLLLDTGKTAMEYSTPELSNLLPGFYLPSGSEHE